VTEPRRPQVISVRCCAWQQPDILQTMRKHPTRALPKTAVKLSDSVWYMPKKEGIEAQVFTRYLDWPYYIHAKDWNAYGAIQPRIELIGARQ